MAQNISLLGATYSAVPAVQLPKQGGGTATFTDVTDTTATASDVASGTYFYTAAGVKTAGTASGGASNDLIITLSWDDDYFSVGNGAWIPDYTYAEVQTAYNDGKTIVVDLDGVSGDGTADGEWEEDGGDEGGWLTYWVHYFDNGSIIEYSYRLTSEGVQLSDVPMTYIFPNFDSPSESYTPTELQITDTVTFDPNDGYNGIQEVDITVNAIPNNYVGSGISQRTSADLSVSGATITAPAGYYASNATKTVASGTAGTPTATKGTVSNHSVNVTPSVTNTTGYITGSTKTGTAVSVSASELVSGDKSITANGTNIDVANYSTVSVNVPGGGGVSTDTKTVTASNYPVSLQFTSMKGEPKMFTVRLNAQVSSSGSTTYYYIVDITSHGTTTHGNCFRIGSTRRVDNITSGYSWSYSGTTLTITSSASSRSASPGAFYSGSYELMYVY